MDILVSLRGVSFMHGLVLAAAAAMTSAAVRADVPDPLAQLEAAQQRIFVEVAPSVVYLTTKEGLGSGFIVSRDGLVLTNHHVVGKQTTVEVVMHDGRRLTGTVVERAKTADLALVQLPLAQTRPVPLGDGDGVRVGAWAAAVGHGRGGIWTFNTGMVSNIYPVESGRPIFQTQIPLNQGSSGGPIVDRRGRVIGVVTAGIVDAQAINFGIKIDVALRELKLLSARCDCLVITAPSGVPVFVDGVLRGAGPRVIAPIEPGRHEVSAVVREQRRRVNVQFPEQRAVAIEADSARSE